MLKRYVSKQKGMALALVLMVMVVLSILGVALLSVANAEANNSIRQQNKLQAHYIAKSGLEAVANNFSKNPNQLKIALDANTVYTGQLQSGTPEYQVELTGSIGGIVTIKSTAFVKNVKDVVSLEVDTAIQPNALFINSIYSNTNLDVSDMNITGPLQSAGTVTAPTGYTDSVTENSSIFVDLFPFPTGLQLSAYNEISNNETLVVSQNTKFNDLTIKNGGILSINTGTSATNIIEIVVNTLDIDSTVKIEGEGSVILYVNTKISMKTSGSVNFGVGTQPSKLLVIMADNSLFYIQGGMGFGGYILGPKAHIDVNSGNITLQGAVVCGNFSQNNNATMTYIPVTGGPSSSLDGIAYTFAKKLYKN